MTSFGQRVRAARRAQGISVRRLGHLVQCPPSYMVDIEGDRRRPSRKVMLRIVEALGMNAIKEEREMRQLVVAAAIQHWRDGAHS